MNLVLETKTPTALLNQIGLLVSLQPWTVTQQHIDLKACTDAKYEKRGGVHSGSAAT